MHGESTSREKVTPGGDICSVNICGFSEKSRFLLNQYIFERNPGLICLQETGTFEKANIYNMAVYQDTNEQQNKGCAILVKNGLSFTQLVEISEQSKSIDTVLGVLEWDGNRLLFGTTYLKLGYEKGVMEFLKMLKFAEKMAKIHGCKGIITMGDFNARHTSWDEKTNTYGEILTNNLNWEDFTISTTETPTFIAANGCSKIDFMVISSNLTVKITNICTDELANLATGAPTTGHVPVWAGLLGRKSRKANPVVEKLDLQSMNWLNWRTETEEQLAKGIEEPKNEAECYKLWDKFRLVIETSTTRNCQTKRISPHSKPYWTEELSAISRKMQKASKSYLTRNTDNNLEEYRRWKEVFENTRKKALEDHLSQETSKLNRAQAEGFWRQLKRMAKSNTSNQIESLWNDRKEILSGNVEIEHEMFETFFETKHIKQNEKDFDEDFFMETNSRYEDLKLNDF